MHNVVRRFARLPAVRELGSFCHARRVLDQRGAAVELIDDLERSPPPLFRGVCAASSLPIRRWLRHAVCPITEKALPDAVMEQPVSAFRRTINSKRTASHKSEWISSSEVP